MKLSMESNNKIKFTLIVGTVILTVLTIFSFFVGRYPLTLSGIISGDSRQWQVFVTLRASRGIVGCIGGFVLGVAGFVFQTVFRNPLASPDIIGVSSGASAGAAFGILFLSGSMAVTASAFAGALGSVVLALMLASLTTGQDGRGIVLAGTQLSPDRAHLPETARRPGKTACIHRILDYGKFKWYQSLYHQRKCDSLYPLCQRTFFVVPADYDAFPAR